MPPKYGGSATWELPHGKVLGEFFECYSKDYERKIYMNSNIRLYVLTNLTFFLVADSYGYTEGYKMKK